MLLGRVPYMYILCGEHFERGDNPTIYFKRAHIRQEIKHFFKEVLSKIYIRYISHERKVCGLVNNGIFSNTKSHANYT